MSDERKRLEDLVGEIAGLIAEGLAAQPGRKICFMLMLFDEGEGGFCAYAANAPRDQVTQALEEHICEGEGGRGRDQGDA